MYDLRTGVFYRGAIGIYGNSASLIGLGDQGFWYDSTAALLKFRAADGTDSIAEGPRAIADPGNTTHAISVAHSGVCSLTSAGAETRTLAAPLYSGQRIALCCDTHGGDIAVTVSAAFDLTPHTIATFTAAGQFVEVMGVTVGGALKWRLVVNDGATLS